MIINAHKIIYETSIKISLRRHWCSYLSSPKMEIVVSSVCALFITIDDYYCNLD
jgi:hypothetical protein